MHARVRVAPDQSAYGPLLELDRISSAASARFVKFHTLIQRKIGTGSVPYGERFQADASIWLNSGRDEGEDQCAKKFELGRRKIVNGSNVRWIWRNES
jgi:hypothetical protein